MSGATTEAWRVTFSEIVSPIEAVIEVEGSDRPAIVADWLAYLQLDGGRLP